MQDVDHMRPTCLKAISVALAVVLTCIQTGCAGSRSDNAGRLTDGSLPAWVQGMREPLQEFPASQSDSVEPNNGVRQRVGEPRELGGMLSGGTSERGAITQNRSSGVESGSGSGVGTVATIDVNVSGLPNGKEPSQPELRAPEPSQLELQYRGDRPRRPDRDLEQFGYAQLRLITPNSAGGPASTDHVLSAGDEVVIDLTTDVVERYRPTVDDDGMLPLEGVGAVRVGGLPFDEARTAIRNEIARVRQGFELSIGLGRLTGVPIRVTGAVFQPGVVDAGSRPTLLDVLSVAEIMPSGTLRSIVVVRSTGERESIDLYGFLLGRTAPPDIRLSRGDTVTVPPIGRTIAIAGSVQRPGIYELADQDGEVSAGQAIELAGGGTGFAIVEQIQIERTDAGRRVLVDVEEDGLEQELRDGDLLLVGAVDGRLHPVVEVRGEVARPGRFQHRQGLTTGDLVRLAGGLTVDAYEGEAVISRVMGAASRRASEWDGALELTSRRVVIIDIGRALAGDPAHDIALEPLDLMRIRRFDEAREMPTVELIGGARRPGMYELTAGLTVADLIALGGHLTPDAFREEAELVRRRRSDDLTILDVDRYRLPLVEILNGSYRGPVLENGDRLILRTLGRAEVRVSAGGLFRFPGEYVLPAGSTVTDLIAAAGGVLDGGDLRAARFTRESVRALQTSRWNELTERTRQTFERNLEKRINSARTKEQFSARVQLEQAQATLDRLRGTQAIGRIALDLTVPDFPESEGNLPLEDGDSLLVPRFSNTVTVQGHVFNPLTVVFESGISADDLLSRAGGSTELADEDKVYVIRADGRVASIEQRGGAFRLKDPLLPGDVLLVPPRPLGRDATSVVLDMLLLARAAGEAGALWNLALGSIEDGSISIVDTPASPRSDSTPPAALLEEFQR